MADTAVKPLTEGTPEERQAKLLEMLDDPSFEGDTEQLISETDEVRTEIEKINKAREARAKLAGSQVREIDTTPAPEARTNTPAKQDETDTRDIAERFVESDSFRQLRSNGYKGQGGLTIDEKEYASLEKRSLIDNTATSGGAFSNPTRPAGVFAATNADRAPRVADLLDRQTTTNNSVEFVQDTTTANYGAAVEVTEGAAKPETTYTFEVKTSAVATIAHWLNLTRQTADDNAELTGYIRGRLLYGLEYRVDGQILNGNGTSPNLRGILNTTGINTHAPVGAEARVISIRKAITLCQVDEFAPTGVVLNPADWELVELSTDNDGMFRVSPSVANAMAPRIWGLNVVATTAVASGTGLVGDFRYGATLWERQTGQIFLTDSHASNFISNILTLLAERRAALTVHRPSAFCKITFNGTT